MSDKSTMLINKALELLENKSYDSDAKYSNLELSEIIHELDVYQAELEIQNNELLIKETELLESKKEYEMFFFKAPVCYIIINNSGEILKFNHETIIKFQDIIKRSSNFASLVKATDYHKYFDWLNMKENKSSEITLDIKVDTKYRKHKVVAKPYLGEDKLYLLMLVDIQEQYNLIDKNVQLSEEKRLREVLIFNQSKITGIGEMLSNVAHQWRQPLNVVGIMISTVKYNIQRDEFNKEQIIDQLSKATQSVEYLSKIIDDFKSYYNYDSIEKLNYNISEVLNDLKKLSSIEFEESGIDLIINSKDINIFKSKTYLLEILINIIKNSKDAFGEVNVEEPVIIIDCEEDGDFVNINIKDNGGGISEANLEKIFEPYFSTKFASIGVGLGLHIVFELVTKHFHGTVEASNVKFKHNKKDYKGANIKISFPKN